MHNSLFTESKEKINKFEKGEKKGNHIFKYSEMEDLIKTKKGIEKICEFTNISFFELEKHKWLTYNLMMSIKKKTNDKKILFQLFLNECEEVKKEKEEKEKFEHDIFSVNQFKDQTTSEILIKLYDQSKEGSELKIIFEKILKISKKFILQQERDLF